jgi:dipeptidyl aminopeptidase/acylaminoacyl peptidase
MKWLSRCVLLLSVAAAMPLAWAQPPPASFTLEQVLGYPFPGDLVAAPQGDAVAWVVNARGVRNIEVAAAPDFKPRRVTSYRDDDGLELTGLTFSPDGKYLVYVRGGDHDADWAVPVAPDPSSNPVQPKVTIWAVALAGGAPVKLAEGDAPAVSADHRVAYLKDDQVWTVSLNGHGEPQPLFFDRGHVDSLRWSPDGRRLAFVSHRGDHAFIGVFSSRERPIEYLAPSTHIDRSPRWSPDGTRIAFTREPGDGGPPEPLLERTPHPWSIWIADVATGAGHAVWRSPHTLAGSYPGTQGGANLHWAAGNRLVFLADLDGWPHLYSAPANGGEPLLLTPGKFMVEDVAVSPDRRFLVYNANTGTTAHDSERRHLYRVPVDAARPVALTAGDTLEWAPQITGDGRHLVFIGAGAKQPPFLHVAGIDGSHARAINAGELPADFPTDQLVVPQDVTFQAPDGLTIHGQLFRRDDGHAAARPGIVLVHGGPSRQMLLGWHAMAYYSNAYAVNQYLASHGFVVLSVNYRLGIGYGHAFHRPAHAGPTGASEYQDVLAGARFLQHVDGVDAQRIGIWGGSYGGFLSALALARNSDVFKAGVDMHGIHDWTWDTDGLLSPAHQQYEQGDRAQAMQVAWTSSPDASIGKWTSPVLLVQGDDDHEVRFHQMVDLARRLSAHHVPFQELVLPNEIHGFLRYASWLRADAATVAFFGKQFGVR